MTTDRSPSNKQIARENEIATEWKRKAMQRREENELLKSRLDNLEKKITTLTNQHQEAINKSIVDDLKRQLEIATKIIAHQQEQILEFKKKA